MQGCVESCGSRSTRTTSSPRNAHATPSPRLAWAGNRLTTSLVNLLSHNSFLSLSLIQHQI
eukprot:3285110-Ditylum_brightwellii.AAC.1